MRFIPTTIVVLSLMTFFACQQKSDSTKSVETGRYEGASTQAMEEASAKNSGRNSAQPSRARNDENLSWDGLDPLLVYDNHVLGYRVGDTYRAPSLMESASAQRLNTQNLTENGFVDIRTIVVKDDEGQLLGMKVDTNDRIESIRVMSEKFKTKEGAHVNMLLEDLMKIYRGKYELFYQYSKLRMAATIEDYPEMVFILDQNGYRGGPDKVKFLEKDILSASDFSKSTRVQYILFE